MTPRPPDGPVCQRCCGEGAINTSCGDKYGEQCPRCHGSGKEIAAMTPAHVVTAADREMMRKIVDERRQMFGNVIDGEEWLVEIGATALAAVRAEQFNLLPKDPAHDDCVIVLRGGLDAMGQHIVDQRARVTALEGALAQIIKRCDAQMAHSVLRGIAELALAPATGATP